MTVPKAVTKRSIGRELFLAYFLITIACAGIFGLFAYLVSFKAGSMAFLSFEMLLFCFLPSWSTHISKRRKAEREQWLREYRASPESHILHLND
jgi:hypothetical protein